MLADPFPRMNGSRLLKGAGGKQRSGDKGEKRRATQARAISQHQLTNTPHQMAGMDAFNNALLAVGSFHHKVARNANSDQANRARTSHLSVR